MSETIVAVLITGVISIITTLLTASINRSKMASELDKRLTVSDTKTSDEISHIKEEIREMKADIKEHNGYAKMFAQTSAVYEEKFRTIDHRLDEVEHKAS